MAADDRFGEAAGETARRLEDMKRRSKRQKEEWEENRNDGKEE